MVANVIVWDIETVPDLRVFAAANGLDGMATSVRFPSTVKAMCSLSSLAAL
jgi:hypothetical protein